MIINMSVTPMNNSEYLVRVQFAEDLTVFKRQ